jgi:hypothetical protein
MATGSAWTLAHHGSDGFVALSDQQELKSMKPALKNLCVATASMLALGAVGGCDSRATLETASISGGVFFDCNRDGDCNEQDCGVENVNIRLYHNACGDELYQTARTLSDGSFAFTELEPGQYCVFLDARLETCGFEANFPTNAISRETMLAPGDTVILQWFGLTRLGDDAAEPLPTSPLPEASSD